MTDIAQEFAMSMYASTADRNAAMLAEIERLRAEVAGLREDAERYRFFRSCFTQPWQRITLARRLGVEDQHFEPSLDAAIDAARKGAT